MSRTIDLIVIHCAATPNGKAIGHRPGKPAASYIDVWHSARGFRRADAARSAFNPQLYAIGYHFVIDADGSIGTGRAESEVGAHVQGHNAHSLGVCMAGTDKFTCFQWVALETQVRSLKQRYPQARIVGHRDLSPDLDGDGAVEPREWTKTCPGFSVADWLANGMRPLADHTLELAK